jgi:hypothetical protein
MNQTTEPITPDPARTSTDMAREMAGDRDAFARKYMPWRTQIVRAYHLRHLNRVADAVVSRLEDRLLGDVPRRAVVDPVFVTGNFRSGTTMLERVLSWHPALGHFTFLSSPFPRAPHYARWMNRTMPGLAATMAVPHHPNLASDSRWPFEGESIWRFCRNNPWSDAPVNVLTEGYSDPAFERVFIAAINKHLDLQGKRRFINKNPLNTLRVGYLAKLFPSARFVHIVRHPARMLRSQLDMARMLSDALGNPAGADYNAAFSNMFLPPGRMFLRTARYPEIARAFAEDPALGVALCVSDTEDVFEGMVEASALHGRLHVLRYEDLVDDFERRMGAIFAFLALDGPDAAEIVRDSARRFLDGELVSRKAPLPRFGPAVEAALAPMMAKYGYSFGARSPSPQITMAPTR